MIESGFPPEHTQPADAEPGVRAIPGPSTGNVELPSPHLVLAAAGAVAVRFALGLAICLSLGLVVIPALAVLNAVPLLLGGAQRGRAESGRYRLGWRLIH